MKTKRTLGMMALVIPAAILIAAGPATADVQIGAKIQIGTRPDPDLKVWIWPDRGEGASYRIGDDIGMLVEANQDCYLILYNIDTRGRLNILYPYDPWSDNFVRGGEVVEFPYYAGEVDWTVEGPPGVEYVQAIASTFPIEPPDWPVYMRSVNGRDGVCLDHELNDYRAYDDRMDYIRVVNRKIAHRFYDWCATDMATFHVRPRHYWRNIHVYDPWPDEFYGEIFIGWPIGGAIYIDGVFIGHAPIRVPRRSWGRHTISCYVDGRLFRTHRAQVHPKSRFNYRRPEYGKTDISRQGHVKVGKSERPKWYQPPVTRRDVRVRSDRHDGLRKTTIRDAGEQATRDYEVRKPKETRRQTAQRLESRKPEKQKQETLKKDRKAGSKKSPVIGKRAEDSAVKDKKADKRETTKAKKRIEKKDRDAKSSQKTRRSRDGR